MHSERDDGHERRDDDRRGTDDPGQHVQVEEEEREDQVGGFGDEHHERDPHDGEPADPERARDRPATRGAACHHRPEQVHDCEGTCQDAGEGCRGAALDHDPDDDEREERGGQHVQAGAETDEDGGERAVDHVTGQRTDGPGPLDQPEVRSWDRPCRR